MGKSKATVVALPANDVKLSSAKKIFVHSITILYSRFNLSFETAEKSFAKFIDGATESKIGKQTIRQSKISLLARRAKNFYQRRFNQAVFGAVEAVFVEGDEKFFSVRKIFSDVTIDKQLVLEKI